MKYTIKSHAIPTSLTAENAAPGIFCRWDSTDSARRVTLGSSVVFELSQAAQDASLAIPRSVEIGGLLLGRVRQEESAPGEPETTIYEISAFQEVPCAHRFGPFYVLDRMDRTRLIKLLARHRRGHPAVIGFYRSYSGTEARLDTADRELLRSFFPQRDLVCLLLNPRPGQNCLADFRFWNDGEVAADTPYAPFAFDASQMKRETVHTETRRLIPSLGLLGADDAEPDERRDQPYDDDLSPVPRRSRVVVPLLLCIPFAIGATAVYDRWQRVADPPPAPVRFDARQVGGGVLLQWDGSAPAVIRATRGVLTVDDGSSPIDLPLTAEQIHGGSLPYANAQDDLLFHLRLFNGDRTVSDNSLRLVTVSAPDHIAAAALPDVPLAPSQAAPQVPPQVPPQDSPQAPVIPVKATLPATAPVARRQVQPYVSEGIRARLHAPLLVPVVVNVDERGRVTHASSAIAGHGLDRYFANEAVKAARKWTFTPARAADGSPTAAEKTLSFEFRPETR